MYSAAEPAKYSLTSHDEDDDDEDDDADDDDDDDVKST